MEKAIAKRKPKKAKMVDPALLERGQWEPFLSAYFPVATRCPFGARHRRLWEWFEALEPGKRPRARVEVWPRGGAKSSTTELGVVRVGTRLTRKFCLYVSETQKQAEKHVQAISNKFMELGEERATSKYGTSMGWRIDLLRTERGFNVLALGLDVAARGVKLDDYRPDLIVFDDIDSRHDSAETVKKKIETITDSILPSGSSDVAVLFVQNKIHRDGIVSQLCDSRADFLLEREPAQVEPAVYGLRLETVEREDGTRGYKIVGGRPSWEGQDLETCERQINEWGRGAFLREAQHEVDLVEDGLWQRERDIEPFRVSPSQRAEWLRAVPELQTIVVAVDPSASSTGDEAGIVVAGASKINGILHGFVLDDCSVQGSPQKWAEEAVRAYNERKANRMVAEQNNGGEMVSLTISTVPGAPKVRLVHASRGKLTRAEPIQKLYEDGRVHHAKEFVELEREMCTWKPGDPSPNRMDALVWALTELMLNDFEFHFTIA